MKVLTPLLAATAAMGVFALLNVTQWVRSAYQPQPMSATESSVSSLVVCMVIGGTVCTVWSSLSIGCCCGWMLAWMLDLVQSS